MPPCIGLSTKMHDKKNATIFAILRQSFAVMWPLEWFKTNFEIFIIIVITDIFFGGETVDLVDKNTAYK